MDPQAVLHEHFGFDDFREGQRELIDAILGGRDCLGVMPTGAGKSICYQVPAISLPGLALVISPLVSLMSDQVAALVDNGVRAAFLNSQLSARAQFEVIEQARGGAYDLLYVAPERLDDSRLLSLVGANRMAPDANRDAPPHEDAGTAFPEATPSAPAAAISLVAVDEAHCVSQWGQDFRPSYLGIARFVAALPSRPPVAAFTATATPRVADDIASLLGLRSPVRVTTGFDRPNLRFDVEQLPEKRKLARIASYALERPGDSGIVYCSTRKATEHVHEALCAAGVRATRYHAGLSPAERDADQRAFVNDDAPVMVATNAFGMGIDKSNVRYVIHHNMPGSLEAYYQEAGRAGRDGEPAECLLLWNDSDIATCRFFIEQESSVEELGAEEADRVRTSKRRRLGAMTGYCTTAKCLRGTILRYFGDARGTADAQGGCGNCGNCDAGGARNAVDVTKTARSIMRCVHELRGRYGKGMVADVLRGADTERIRQFGLDRARTYGILDESAGAIKEIIELLVAGEYLEVSEGRYPLVGLGPRAREAATDDFRLYSKRKQPAGRAERAKGKAGLFSGRKGSGAFETPEQQDLFERLRRLRKRLADEAGVPPYVVFNDATLRAMAVERPRTEEELLAIPGVGPTKLARYGATFLAELS